jgi:starch phosphorylase
LRADEVTERNRRGLDASDEIAASPALSEVLEAIAAGVFSPGEPRRFDRLTQALRHADPYMVAADFTAYWEAQRAVDALWRQRGAWTRATIVNIAGMAGFSSDRAIGEYLRTVWDGTG